MMLIHFLYIFLLLLFGGQQSLEAKPLCGTIAVGMFAVTDGFDTDRGITTASFQQWCEYCSFWGYTIHAFEKGKISKAKAILTMMQRKYDYIVWIDGYTKILDKNNPIEQHIQKDRKGSDIILTRDICQDIIGCRAMGPTTIIKNNACTLALIEDIVQDSEHKIRMGQQPLDLLKKTIAHALYLQQHKVYAFFVNLWQTLCSFVMAKKPRYERVATYPVVADLSVNRTEKKVLIEDTTRAGARSIALVTLSTLNRAAFSVYAMTSLVEYAERWGYHLFIHRDVLDADRPSAWSKIKAVRNILSTQPYEYVVWVDDDIFITNPNKPIEDFIAMAGDKAELILSAHMEKPVVARDINSGFFIVKKTDWAMNFLDRVWDLGNYRYTKETGPWDQGAITELCLSPEFCNDKRIVRLPGRVMQSMLTILKAACRGDYGQWQPGDFAAHMAAAHQDARIFIFTQLAQDPSVYPSLKAKTAKNFTIKQEQPLLATERGWFVADEVSS